jgi:hypothetical protein
MKTADKSSGTAAKQQPEESSAAKESVRDLVKETLIIAL